MDGLHNGRHGLGEEIPLWEEETPPIPTATSSPINVVDDKEEVFQPTQVTTLPASSSQSLTSYLALLGTPALPPPLYGNFHSPRMALMGSPSVQHMMRPDMHPPHADKNN